MVLLLLSSSLQAQITFERWYGGPDCDHGYSVVQTLDGGYFITGSTESFRKGYMDVYLVKTDSLGDTLWTKTYGGVFDDWGGSGIQTTDGGYIITGGTGKFYPSDTLDIYLIKTDSIGDTLWTKVYGGPKCDIGHSIVQSSDGGYIITGITGTYQGNDTFDIFLMKTDSLGDTV